MTARKEQPPMKDQRGERGRNKATSPWRPPTRRAFVAMIGAAAAALAAPTRGRMLLGAAAEEQAPAARRATATCWIGHC
jgi:hypothetical protein